MAVPALGPLRRWGKLHTVHAATMACPTDVSCSHLRRLARLYLASGLGWGTSPLAAKRQDWKPVIPALDPKRRASILQTRHTVRPPKVYDLDTGACVRRSAFASSRHNGTRAPRQRSAIAASCTPAKQSLFYHLIGAAKQHRRTWGPLPGRPACSARLDRRLA
jgi:hypothetical protein